jgi:hypothetical protein
MKNIVLIIFSIFVILNCFSQTQEKRFALIIGNSKYTDFPLKMPENNAKAIALELQKLGFEVTLQTNISRENFINQIEKFKATLFQNKGVGLFFYAGYGFQHCGESFLIPVDAKIQSEDDLEHEAINLKSTIRSIDSARNDLNIIMIDVDPNCPYGRYFRNTPAVRLEMIHAINNSVIAYSSSPTSCGCDNYSSVLYTQEFLKALQIPNINIDFFFKIIRRNVYNLSENKQLPWEDLSGEINFYFNKKIDE